MHLRLQNGSDDLKPSASLLKMMRTGRPVAAISEKEIGIIKELIKTDARYRVEELAQISGISSSSVYRILTDRLGLKKSAEDGSSWEV